jgi:hypothetical protein
VVRTQLTTRALLLCSVNKIQRILHGNGHVKELVTQHLHASTLRTILSADIFVERLIKADQKRWFGEIVL